MDQPSLQDLRDGSSESAKIKLWVGTEKHEVEISAARAHGAQVLFVFLQTGLCLQDQETLLGDKAPNLGLQKKVKSGSSSFLQALAVSSNQGIWGREALSVQGVPGNAEAELKLHFSAQMSLVGAHSHAQASGSGCKCAN